MSTSEVLHISEKPWSDYTEADYTIEQWHAACLIHLHDGPPTSKSQCKLPVKTPNGALNRNGVHAAAAALAGARSPLKASPEQKAKAAAALRGYYSQLDETPPDSLKQSESFVEDFLSHYGVKGMKWGVRKSRSSRSSGPQPVTVRPSKFPGSKRLVTKGGKGHATTEEATRSREIGQIGKKSGTKALTNKQLEEYNRRLNLEQNFNRLSYDDKNAGQKFVAHLTGQAQRTARDAGNDVASHQVKKRLAKRGLVAAGKTAAAAAAV